MPYYRELINGGTGVLRSGKGFLTGKEMIELASRDRSWEIDWNRINHFILDLEAVTRFEMSSAEIREMVAIHKQNAGLLAGLRFLAIAAPQDVEFGMARMFGSLLDRSGLELRVYRTMAGVNEALASSGLIHS
jgi:hypothetical protein